MVLDVVDTFTTPVGLVYGVTDTECWARKWQHSHSCFRDFQTSIFNEQDKKSSEKK